MPKAAELPEHPTPFARVLLDYMWSRRPPLNQGQLAARLDLSRQTVRKWILVGSPPSLDTALYVLDKLQIPIQNLLDEYANDKHKRPAPASDNPKQETLDAPAPDQLTNRLDGTSESSIKSSTHAPLEPYAWAAMIEQTERELRAAGMDDEIIGAVIDRIRAKQIGSPQLAANIAAEHSEPTAPDVTRRAQPTRSRPRRNGGNGRAAEDEGGIGSSH